METKFLNDLTKKSKIDKIKFIIEEWGMISVGELELDSSPCLNSIGETICELIEMFNIDMVNTVVYHNDNEIDNNSYTYEELPDDIVNEILEIIEKYNFEMENEN